MSAIDYAAWKGDEELCEFLLANSPSGIRPLSPSPCNPIHYAAAGGHIQTIGNLLFKHDPARCLNAVAEQSKYMRSFCSGLQSLCTDQLYDDANWLLEICKTQGAFTSTISRDSFKESLTAALGRLCGIDRPANYTLNLRQQQDFLNRKGALDAEAKDIEKRARNSEMDRIALEVKLLRYGADPNLEVRTWGNHQGEKYLPIYYPTKACLPKMVNLLIENGASLTLPEKNHHQQRSNSTLPKVPWGNLLLIPLIGEYPEGLRKARYDIFKILVENGADGEGLQDAWFESLSRAGVPLLLHSSPDTGEADSDPEQRRDREAAVAFLFSVLEQENGDTSSSHSIT